MNHWGGPCHRADSDSAGRGGAWTCMSKQLPGDTAAAAGLQTPRGVQSCRPTDNSILASALRAHTPPFRKGGVRGAWVVKPQPLGPGLPQPSWTPEPREHFIKLRRLMGQERSLRGAAPAVPRPAPLGGGGEASGTAAGSLCPSGPLSRVPRSTWVPSGQEVVSGR